jgi:hypothetical protein
VAFKNKMLLSKNVHDHILLVILCTGSRWIEVVNISDYYVADETDWKTMAEDEPVSSYHGADATRDIVVRGIAKNKAANNVFVDQDKSIKEKEIEASDRTLAPKPVVFVSPKVIQYLVYKSIRPYIKRYLEKIGNVESETSNAALAGKLNSKTNERLRFHNLAETPYMNSRVSTHTLRKVYGNYSYDLYADKRITKIAWLNMVLGHKPSSFGAALHYNTASIFDAAPQKDKLEGDNSVQIKELEVAVKEAKIITDLLRVWRGENIVENVTRIIQSMSGKRPLLIDKRENADKVGEIPFVTKKRKILYIPPVSRSGISHAERSKKYRDTKKLFEAEGITRSYDNFQRLGFSSSYIAKAKKLGL